MSWPEMVPGGPAGNGVADGVVATVAAGEGVTSARDVLPAEHAESASANQSTTSGKHGFMRVVIPGFVPGCMCKLLGIEQSGLIEHNRAQTNSQSNNAQTAQATSGTFVPRE
jgi:hypothetical protein